MQKTTFEDSTGAVYAALVRVVGREKAEILDFYVDSRLAGLDRATYERALEGLLGEEAAQLVINGLRSELLRGPGTKA